MIEEKYQEDITAIRSMMERSSRFISLSGLSGVAAGSVALLGAIVAFFLFHRQDTEDYSFSNRIYTGERNIQLLLIALVILVLALSAGIYFTIRKNRRLGLKIWTKTTKNLLINLFIPLIAGGIFCLALLYHGQFQLLAPATLVFYGLALICASKYTYDELYYLGLLEVALGLIASFMADYGLVFWLIGFAILHILYGILMHRKYP